MNNGWDNWNGKKVFVRLRTGKIYNGKVVEIDQTTSPIIFISIIDKFGDKVTFAHSEITELKSEEHNAK